MSHAQSRTVPSQLNLQQRLMEVRGDDREAVFEMLAEDKKGQTVTVPVRVHTC